MPTNEPANLSVEAMLQIAEGKIKTLESQTPNDFYAMWKNSAPPKPVSIEDAIKAMKEMELVALKLNDATESFNLAMGPVTRAMRPSEKLEAAQDLILQVMQEIGPEHPMFEHLSSKRDVLGLIRHDLAEEESEDEEPNDEEAEYELVADPLIDALPLPPWIPASDLNKEAFAKVVWKVNTSPVLTSGTITYKEPGWASTTMVTGLTGSSDITS